MAVYQSTHSRLVGGFTLLEVTVALLLFALTAGGVASVLSTGLGVLSYTRDLVIVQAALQREMAYLRSARPQTLTTGSDQGFLSGETSLTGLGKCTGKTTILPSKDYPGVYEVEVLLEWRDRTGQTNRTIVETMLPGVPQP